MQAMLFWLLGRLKRVILVGCGKITRICPPDIVPEENKLMIQKKLTQFSYKRFITTFIAFCPITNLLAIFVLAEIFLLEQILTP